jgi:hypothetical protein
MIEVKMPQTVTEHSWVKKIILMFAVLSSDTGVIADQTVDKTAMVLLPNSLSEQATLVHPG